MIAVQRRFASTVAARAPKQSDAHRLRVGHVVRAAADRFDYNDAIISAPQNIKFTSSQTLVRPEAKTFFFRHHFFFCFFFAFFLFVADSLGK
jgi:hypothetical protein